MLPTLQEAGAQAVATAIMATLPGIDANDPRKTLACFRLYCVVLSSVGTLQVGFAKDPFSPLPPPPSSLPPVHGLLGPSNWQSSVPVSIIP